MATIASRLLSRRTLTGATSKAAEHLPQVNSFSHHRLFFRISFRIDTQKLQGLWQCRRSWWSYLLGYNKPMPMPMPEAKKQLDPALYYYRKLLEKEQAAVDRTINRLHFGFAVVTLGSLLARFYLGDDPPESGRTATPISDGV
ncbi:hypothetical protein ZWY2020_033429 [Hordeum vulgare]|nr:hypothetical protein ZWY2020_033429 [Hordeum vulgare]